MSGLPQTLAVPVDGSSNANAAAAYAARLAEQLGTKVNLLYAFPETPEDLFGVPPDNVNLDSLKYFSPDAFAELRKESAAAAFHAARKAIGDIAVAVDEQVITGKPGQAILDYASGANDILIVMGRRGLSHFKEIMMGSTTQYVLHHAKCPVLVIR